MLDPIVGGESDLWNWPGLPGRTFVELGTWVGGHRCGPYEVILLIICLRESLVLGRPIKGC